MHLAAQDRHLSGRRLAFQYRDKQMRRISPHEHALMLIVRGVSVRECSSYTLTVPSEQRGHETATTGIFRSPAASCIETECRLMYGLWRRSVSRYRLKYCRPPVASYRSSKHHMLYPKRSDTISPPTYPGSAAAVVSIICNPIHSY